MAEKVHKVTVKNFRRAVKFRRQNGFINPAVSDSMETVCGIEPLSISAWWPRVTCKRCLAKRGRR